MSHNILENDIALRAFNTPVSWHGLEKSLDESNDFSPIAIKYSKEILPLPEGYSYANGNCNHAVVAHKNENEKIVICTASDSYNVVGNDMIMETVQNAFDKHGIPAKLNFAVTLGNLSKVALTYTIEGMEEFFAGGDEHKQFLTFVGGHDKTMGIRGFGTSRRSVCQNQLNLALKGVKHHFDFSFFHSKIGIDNFNKLPELMEASLLHAKEYSDFAEKLGNQTINIHQAKMIALQILQNSHEIPSTAIVNRAEGVSNLFKNGLGNKGENLFDLVNGVTEMFTKGDGSGKQLNMRKMVSAEYGTAAQVKIDFVNALRTNEGELISQNEIDILVRQGERLLSEYEKKKESNLVTA